MAVVLRPLGTAFELVLLAACVHGCLTVKKHLNSKCREVDTMLSSGDVLTFEMTYDKPACEVLALNISACWRFTRRNQTKPSDRCQYKWAPIDSCNPESKSGCYKQENNITFYLRHVLDETLQDMLKLNCAVFEVSVKRNAFVYQYRDRYFHKRYEMFPMVFDVEDEKLTVNEEEISLNVTSYTIMSGMYYDLEYCVYNLIKGSLRVDLGGNVTMNRPNAPCVHALFIARKAHDGSEVTLSFTEKGGCKRPGRATSKFALQVDMSTDMIVTESTTEPSSSSLPHIQCWSVVIGFILACFL